MIASLMVAVLCSFSPSSTNSQYPSYQYCADMGCEVDFLLPSMIAVNGDYLYCTSHLTFNAKLYFNDSTSWRVDDMSFNQRVTVYNIDTDTNLLNYLSGTYDYTGHYYTNENFDSFRIDYCYYFEDDTFTYYIKDGGNYIFTDNETYSFELQDAYYFDYVWYDNSVLYGQIQDYVQETLGYYDGYNSGVSAGYNTGYSDGYYDGNAVGHQDGFAEGYQLGSSQDEAAVAIFSGIINIALIPINFFLACLNFEVFGINIGAFVSALLTVAIVVIITRMVVNGGNGGNNG